MNALAVRDEITLPEKVESVLIQGDLAKLSPEERCQYYRAVCDSLGLNYLTQPFAYFIQQGKLILYAKRDACDQLRARDRVSVRISARELTNDVYVVTARAITPDGRCEESIGAVAVAGLKGEALANAYMKAETKAKRRVTLSLVGLGWMDETEAATIPQARPVRVDTETGEIFDAPAPAALPAEGSERGKLRDKWAALRDEGAKFGVQVPGFPAGKTNEEIVAEAKAWSEDIRKAAHKPAPATEGAEPVLDGEEELLDPLDAQ